MKLDVEGFEMEVLKGAAGLLQQYNVLFIMTECSVGMLGRGGARDYLRWGLGGKGG